MARKKKQQQEQQQQSSSSSSTTPRSNRNLSSLAVEKKDAHGDSSSSSQVEKKNQQQQHEDPSSPVVVQLVVEEEEEEEDEDSSSKPTRPHIAFTAETVGGEEEEEDEDVTSPSPLHERGEHGEQDDQHQRHQQRQRHSNPQDAELRNPATTANTTTTTINGDGGYHSMMNNNAKTKTNGGRRNTTPTSKRRRRRQRHSKSTVSASQQNSTDETTTTTNTKSWKRRKRGRLVHIAHIIDDDDDDNSTPSLKKTTTTTLTTMSSMSFPPLPGNQYSTLLRRRAIRKLEDLPEQGNNNAINDNHDRDDQYGDISLGMKLIVAGGRVIVQTLNALSDGRASPAQLTGVIQRGDVLLAVGDVSLDKLPIDQLMMGLKPLSAPETPDGRYRRVLRLRLEAGAGHELLQSHEQRGLLVPSPSSGGGGGGGTEMNDMFALFPMVDQLSGAPLLFEPPIHSKEEEEAAAAEAEQEDEKNKEKTEPPSKGEGGPSLVGDEDLGLTTSSSHHSSWNAEKITPDELISALLAKERTLDRERFSSEYFNWSERFSDLLRATLEHNNTSTEEHAIGAGLTKSERILLGQKVMKLAKSLTYNMEDMDKGKDLRSFKTWSTNFSLRSGASARRRHVMDAASLRSHRHHDVNDALEMDDSVGSAGSGSFGSVDGDALLLGLAAHDDIWRKQVVDALKKSIQRMETGEESDDEEEKQASEKPDDINVALSNEFGAFLFGENMNSIIKKKKKSYALPPEDITTVLFDLTTHITTAAPDQVTVFGGTTNGFSCQSTSVGTQGKAKAQLRTDIMLANRFILDEVLPVWLKSFRPLGLEQRRLFWPKIRRGSSGSHGGTSTFLSSDNDSLTVDSSGSAPKATGLGTRNLQEMIEDLELDVETRAETCFLVTYYFTQQILSKYSGCSSESHMEPINEQVARFAKIFGTYLQIHSCLAFSANVEAEKAVDELLTVARYDPSHRDAVREIQKGSNLTFYDASKLSALLEFLHKVRYETTQSRKVIQSLCVAAYPDVQPWQVKRACLDPLLVDKSKKACSDEILRDFYYSYLSQLLDPVEGHEAARHNTKLIKEWCEWSIGVNNRTDEKRDNDKLQNFYRVASRTSSAHLAYRRDLPTLLEMSMGIKEYNLALELTTEIIEDRKLCTRANTVHRVLVCLREIGMEGLSSAWDTRQDGSGFHTLKRVLRAFQQMSTSKFDSCRESIEVPEELLTLLEEWERKTSSKNSSTSELLILVDFMINESAPVDVLSALVLWSSSNELGPALFSRLDSLLRRGVQVALKSELSGSLLRLKYMRRGYTDENKHLMLSEDRKDDSHDGGGIWKRMSFGNLSIDK